MSSKAAEMLRHPPGVKFCPDDDELVEFFLLPRVRGEPSWFPGVLVIDDDRAANTHPSKLLERHGLAGDNNAYFFVRTSDAAGRQDRRCAGGGRWVSQKPEPKVACIGGQEITWRRANLNLQMNRGKSGGGSNGWVMHEYILIEPPCPSLKICHVTLSGHGKDSIIKRVPDGEAGCQADEPAPKRARVAAAAANNSGSSKTKMISDQEPPSVVAYDWSATCQVYGSTEAAMDQGYSASGYQEQQLSLSERVTRCLLQPLTAQEIAEIDAGAGDTAFFRELMALDTGEPRNQEPMHQTRISDKGPSAASACASAYQQEHYPAPFLIDQDISPTSNIQQLLDLPKEATPYMEFEEHEQQQATDQPVQSSTWSFPYAETASADLYLEQMPATEQHQPMVPAASMAECQGISATAHSQQLMVEETASTAEQHHGLDEQQLFWKSIGVDIDNIVAF
ncbi:unnamed protein product [Urochloa humidicola]